MRIITLLIASGGLLLSMAAPVSANDDAYYENDVPDRYHYEDHRRTAMPHWLKRKTSFRSWYKHSPHKRRPAISWARLYEVYSWERRNAHRYRGYRGDRSYGGHYVFEYRNYAHRGRRRH